MNINILTHVHYVWAACGKTCVASMMQRFLVPVSTVSARNAWHNDPHLYIKYGEKARGGGGGGASIEIVWGVCGTFPEILKSVIFLTLFQT